MIFAITTRIQWSGALSDTHTHRETQKSSMNEVEDPNIKSLSYATPQTTEIRYRNQKPRCANSRIPTDLKKPSREHCRGPHGHAHPRDATLQAPRNTSRAETRR